MLNFKREFSITDVLAFTAIIVSGIALWQSYNANNPYIVVSNGPVMTGVLQENGKCTYLAQMPVELNNSGGRSIVFERFYKEDNLTPIIYTKNREIVKAGAIGSDLYLSKLHMRAPYEWSVASMEALELNLDAGRFLRAVIPPGKSYRSSIIIKASTYKGAKSLADTVLLALVAEFSDGQRHEVRGSFTIPQAKPECSK